MKLLLASILFDLGTSSVASWVPRGHIAVPQHRAGGVQRPSMKVCQEHWFEQTLDHFGAAPGPGGITSFKQRYVVCLQAAWQQRNEPPGPIFFYAGNEANVELYINASGLMWENAPSFGALLVFAEHRYYGLSQPFGEDSLKHLQYLSTEQALADYAVLLAAIRKQLNAPNAPAVAFGGSYGGMLASWMRMKYPHAICGAIAASAPILGFPGISPEANPNAYFDIVTASATPKGGAPSACSSAVRAAWDRLFELAKSESGRAKIGKEMNLCGVPDKKDDAISVYNTVADAFSSMAMGNFPYPSSYLLDGVGALPAWPIRHACERALDAIDEAEKESNESDEPLLRGLAAAAAVYYNATGELACLPFGQPVNNASAADGNLWNYQSCTEMIIPMSTNGQTDMFWPQPWDFASFSENCRQMFGVTPREDWAATEYGGRRLNGLTNVVFSNGVLDPWSGYGVTESDARSAGADVIVLPIEWGAHHLDLMFSDPDDPVSVIEAREIELAAIKRWIDAEYARLKTGTSNHLLGTGSLSGVEA